MGQQSCVVLTGFILLHLAFILNLIALATPYWVYAPASNSTVPQNASHDTENSTTKGLWQICPYGDCQDFETSQPMWFNGIRIAYTIGVVTCFLALLLDYMFFLISRLQNVLWFNAIITICVNVAAVIIIVTVALMCKWSQTDFTDLFPPVVLGWSSGIAIAGMVFTFLSGVLVAREMCLLVKEPVLYQDL